MDDSVKHTRMIVKIDIEWIRLNAEKLSNFRDHPALLVQHRVAHAVIDKSLKQGDGHMIGVRHETVQRGVCRQLPVISHKYHLFKRWYNTCCDICLQSFSRFLNEKYTRMQSGKQTPVFGETSCCASNNSCV